MFNLSLIRQLHLSFRVVKHWYRPLKEIEESPSLEILKSKQGPEHSTAGEPALSW